MLGFIGLFYVSFLYHAIKTPEHFRTLVVSLLLLQTLGGLAYLVAPAIGPFIYEKGVDPTITDGQQSMMQFYQFSLAQGPRWIAQHGGVSFTVGLAAMPSLHAAGCLSLLPLRMALRPRTGSALFDHPAVYHRHLGGEPLALYHRCSCRHGAGVGVRMACRVDR